jgi:hypothetical protein
VTSSRDSRYRVDSTLGAALASRRRVRTLLVLAAALVSTAALADPPVPAIPLAVQVRETASIDVGFSRGILCDDASLVRVDLRGISPTQNRFYVTGLRPGATYCKVGTLRGSPVVLLRITVVP